MAEPTPSSAPLKTAEGAYPALPEPVDQLAQADGFNVIGTADVSTAGQMRAYAAQAVAAQPPGNEHKALAALRYYRDECTGYEPSLSVFEKMVDEALSAAQAPAGEPVAYRVMRLRHDGEWTSDGRYWYDGRPSSELASDIAKQPESWRIDYAYAALAATPPLPATEDSSAGDLAELDAWHQAVLNACMATEACYVARDAKASLDNLIDWHIDNERRDPAEVQPEPVAQEPTHWRAVIDPEQEPQRVFLKQSIVLFREKRFAESWIAEQFDFYGWRYSLEPLYTTPQAQPADALDAQRWRDHIGKLDALVTYCPTCCQGFTAKPEMTRDEVIFECGKTAGRSAAMAAAQEGGNAAKGA